MFCACSSEESPPPDATALGPTPYGCEEVVDDFGECTPLEDLCRPDICGSWTCCFVENNEWREQISDCFEGCGI